MNLKKLTRLMIDCILFLLFIYTNNVFASLADNDYFNIIGVWNYYDIISENDINSGEIVINNCKNNQCSFYLNTVSHSWYLCTVDNGVVKIKNNKFFIEFLNDEGILCKNEIIVNNNKISFVEFDKFCSIISDAPCGSRGFVKSDGYVRNGIEHKKLYKTSFKCKNLNLIADILTCTNEDLALLDLKLNKLYNVILQKYRDDKDKIFIIKNKQMEWIIERNNLYDIEEMEKMYKKQINILKNFK